MDVNNAFLNGELTEEIYMNPLEGYTIPTGKTLRLTKSIYGLKQASCQWYAKLSEALLQWDFTLASSDHSLFVQQGKAGFLALIVYVNDIVIVSNNLQQLTAVKTYLHDLFKIKILKS